MNNDKIMDKLLNHRQLKKLDIDLFDGKNRTELEKEYQEKRTQSIAEWITDHNLNRDRAEAEWDKLYPSGFEDWVKNYTKLTGIGQQRLIDKINEIIDYLNQES